MYKIYFEKNLKIPGNDYIVFNTETSNKMMIINKDAYLYVDFLDMLMSFFIFDKVEIDICYNEFEHDLYVGSGDIRLNIDEGIYLHELIDLMLKDEKILKSIGDSIHNGESMTSDFVKRYIFDL